MRPSPQKNDGAATTGGGRIGFSTAYHRQMHTRGLIPACLPLRMNRFFPLQSWVPARWSKSAPRWEFRDRGGAKRPTIKSNEPSINGNSCTDVSQLCPQGGKTERHRSPGDALSPKLRLDAHSQLYTWSVNPHLKRFNDHQREGRPGFTPVARFKRRFTCLAEPVFSLMRRPAPS